MTDRDTRYLLRPAERTAVSISDRRLRVLGAQDDVPAPLLPFGDVELQVERDGARVVLRVIGMPLLTGSVDEAARLADALRSIVGRP